MPIPSGSDRGYAGTATLEDLMMAVEADLHNSYALKEVASSLSQDIGATDLTVFVDEPQNFGRGAIEITSDDGIEEIMISSKSDQDGSLTVYPWGRGYHNTDATTHTAGSRVVANPIFPRQQIIRAINETIQACYPELFAVGIDESQTVSISGLSNNYICPVGTDGVMALSWFNDVAGTWVPVRRFNYIPEDNTVSVFSPMRLGAKFRIVYRIALQPLRTLQDSLITAGLPSSMENVVTLGATARLLRARVSRSSSDFLTEPQIQTIATRGDTALQALDNLEQQFEIKLQEEADALRRKFSPRLVFRQ